MGPKYWNNANILIIGLEDTFHPMPIRHNSRITRKILFKTREDLAVTT